MPNIRWDKGAYNSPPPPPPPPPPNNLKKAKTKEALRIKGVRVLGGRAGVLVSEIHVYIILVAPLIAIYVPYLVSFGF